MSQKLPIGVKLSYSVGQIAVAAKDLLFHYYFLFFFSTVLGISGALVGLAKLVALLVDAITDPVMGGVSDNWRSKAFGRRHLFFIVSAAPLGVGLWFLFDPVDGLSERALVVWMFAFAVLVRTSLTLFFVPYISLNADLTDDYEERTLLSTLRVFFGNIAGVIMGGVILTVYLANTADYPDGRLNPDGYAAMGHLSAIVAVLAILLCFIGTRGRIPALNNQTDRATSVAWWRSFGEIAQAFSLSSFRGLSLGFIAFATIAGVATALAIIILTYFWDLSQEQIFLVFLSTGLAVIPGAIFAPIMAAMLEKRGAIVVSTVLFAVFYAAPIIGRLLGVMPENGDPALFPIVLAFNFASQIFGVCVTIIPESMMADVASEYEKETGRRQEGVLFSAISFARKASFGVGGFVAGVGLDVIRFPKQAGQGDVADTAIHDLGLISGPVVLGLCLFALVFFVGYPITKAKHRETILILTKNRELTSE